MSTDQPAGAGPRRLALVLARHSARPGAPPGVDPSAFASACLADSYEVLADLVQVSSGIVGDGDELDELLWPDAVRLPEMSGIRALVAAVDGRFDELILLPADVPDLPGLVVAKVFKALQRADVCVAPERGPGGGLTAIGLRVPWPDWIAGDLDLDHDPLEELLRRAPGRTRVAVGPDWHRLRSPAAIGRLDPGLEGWEMTRSLLSGRRLAGG